MRKLMQLLFIMLLGVALLAACGEDTASDDNTTETNNNDVTESEKGNEPEDENTDNEGTDTEANEDTEVDKEESTAENNNDSSGFAEDQQLTLGETGLSDSTLGAVEITLNNVRTEDEIEGETPPSDLFIVTELTIENVSEESIDAQDLTVADLMNDEESTVGVFWYYGFEGEIEPGKSIETEMVFSIRESSYYELIYGYGASTVSNEVRWRFEADDIE